MKVRLAAVLTAASVYAHAQPVTTGELRGTVTDRARAEAAAGATVIATSPALLTPQVAIADAHGEYLLPALPPGEYTLTVIYADRESSRSRVIVQLGKQAVINIDVATSGETIEINGTPPTIDQGSTKLGVTLTDDYTRNMPVPRSFGSVVGVSPGAQPDQYGISFAGTTSPETTYLVDGMVANDPLYSTLATDLPVDFIEETEVITGGYGAAYGRAMGGIINVITKQGSNRLRGSVFSYYTPGALAAGARTVRTEGGSLDARTELDHMFELGAELGGPVVRDRLWFHAGFAPQRTQNVTTRIVAQQVDEDADGIPDRDPETGFTRRVPVTSSEIATHATTYFFTAKLSGAVDANHRGELATFGNPTTARDLLGVASAPGWNTIERDRGSYNAIARWTSRLPEHGTTITARAGWHRTSDLPEAGATPQVQYAGYERSLHDFADVEVDGIEACADDGPADAYPLITNCPISEYITQGRGFLDPRRNDRLAAAVAVRQHVRAAGLHVVDAGVDVERTRDQTTFELSGGAHYFRFPDGFGRPRWRFLEYAAPTLDTHDTTVGAYVQDNWHVRPFLTVAVGARVDRQTVFVSDELAGTISAAGEVVPERAFQLTNIAPRIGITYDPTHEGRAKLFAHYGHYTEHVPLAINGHYGAVRPRVTTFACGVDHGDPDLLDAVRACPVARMMERPAVFNPPAPGLRAQYARELVAGVEHELGLDGLVLGVAYQHRDVPVVIEDVSTDGGNTLFVANPGEGPAKQFDRPIRRYDAVQVTLTQRPTPRTLVAASYTYSQNRGNYPGLFSPETGQLVPNANAIYDLPALLANRYGPIGLDRPHALKADGFYRAPVHDDRTELAFGTSIRAQSGLPRGTLAPSPVGSEAYLLPSGSHGRTPMTWQLDLQLALSRVLARGRLDAMLTVFNLTNADEATTVDPFYTRDGANPVVDGEQGDLAHVKVIDLDGYERNRTIRPNKNAGNATSYQRPRTIRFGLRWTF